MKIGSHVIYVRMERDADKQLKPVSYEATLLGQEAAAEGTEGAARLVFVHPDKLVHLNSADWPRAFEYAELVPFEPEGEFFHGFSLPERAKRPAQSEGVDALVAVANEQIGQPANPVAPSPVTETKQYTDGSSATGIAPLPNLSPEQQAAEEAQTSAEATASTDPVPAPEAAQG